MVNVILTVHKHQAWVNRKAGIPQRLGLALTTPNHTRLGDHDSDRDNEFEQQSDTHDRPQDSARSPPTAAVYENPPRHACSIWLQQNSKR